LPHRKGQDEPADPGDGGPNGMIDIRKVDKFWFVDLLARA
jgi:hypothetical protein